MKCDKCGEELDFEQMRKNNWEETKEKNLKVFIVVELWKRHDIGQLGFRYEYVLRGIWTDHDIAEKWKDYLEAEYEDKFGIAERPRVYLEKTRLNHLYGGNMFQSGIVRR